jgi:hypothetical protein
VVRKTTRGAGISVQRIDGAIAELQHLRHALQSDSERLQNEILFEPQRSGNVT